MRYVAFFIICCAGGGIGGCFLRRYREKRRFYEDLLRLINECGIYMKYTRIELGKIFEESSSYAGKTLTETITNYRATQVFSLPREESYCPLISLTADEKREIDGFFDGLGKTDADGQLKHVTLFAERFGKRLEEAREKEIRKGGGCVKLGLLGGIFVCILLF